MSYGNRQRSTQPRPGGIHGGINGERGDSQKQREGYQDSFDLRYSALVVLLKKAVEAFEPIKQARDQNLAPTDVERTAHKKALEAVKGAVLGHPHLVDVADQKKFLNRLQNLVFGEALPLGALVSLSQALKSLSYEAFRPLCGKNVTQRINQLKALWRAERDMLESDHWFCDKERGCVKIALELMGPNGAIQRAVDECRERNLHSTAMNLKNVLNEVNDAFWFLVKKAEVAPRAAPSAAAQSNGGASGSPAASAPNPVPSEPASAPSADESAPTKSQAATATAKEASAAPPAASATTGYSQQE